MAKWTSKKDGENPAESEGGAAPPPKESTKPYEGGEPKRHPDTGEPQPVDDPPGDPARQPQPGDRGPDGKTVQPKGARAKAAAPTVKRQVAVRGHPALTVEFEEPQDADDKEKATEKAAVEAYKAKLGIWKLPAEATVTDAPADDSEEK